ncbi:MAG: dienelactone hydrolase [Glaciihabitans sp.]|nr:dienelactone hydrolase [Glaciihabitans sp.]
MMTAGPPTSDLSGWARGPFTGAGQTHDCYEKGSGPGVVLIPEIPGITPEVLGLAEHLVQSGFTVVVPSPFGVPGKADTGGYRMGVVLRLCVSSEFRAFATNAHRPITDYIRAVAANLASRTPAAGVGVIGMCFTGGFALAAAVSDDVLAAVMSQPAVPFPLGRARQLDPGMSEEEMNRVVERANAGEVCGLGLRFSNDVASPPARFKAIKRRLGDAFEYIQLDSSPGNAGHFASNAHSVLTNEVRDVPGHPALAARERVVEFLRKQLPVAV